MRKTIWKAASSANRQQEGRSRRVANPIIKNAPPDLASLIRGLYARVARELGVDPSYVSRVARSERESETVEAELRRQLAEIVKRLNKRRNERRKRPSKQETHRKR
jgi:transcriptional regulator with XRE-family HTH domain